LKKKHLEDVYHEPLDQVRILVLVGGFSSRGQVIARDMAKVFNPSHPLKATRERVHDNKINKSMEQSYQNVCQASLYHE